MFLFAFSFIILLPRINLHLMTFQVLSWWFLQNNVQIGGFVDFVCKLARQNLFSFFFSPLGRPRHIKACVFYFFFSFFKISSTYVCIYVYIYTYTSIIITWYFCSPFLLLLAEILLEKGSIFALFYLLSCLALLQFSKLN